MKVEEAIDALEREMGNIRMIINELESVNLDLELENSGLDDEIIEDVLYYIGGLY